MSCHILGWLLNATDELLQPEKACEMSYFESAFISTCGYSVYWFSFFFTFLFVEFVCGWLHVSY